MNKEHKQILRCLETYLANNPGQRFGQAIFNLKINEFIKTDDPKNINYNLRDIYNDSNQEILSRISDQLNWYQFQKKVNDSVSNVYGLKGMTVNERLHVTGLMEDFDDSINNNIENARFILRAIKVDEESISRTLKENGY